MLSQTSPVVFEGSKAFGQKFILGAAILRQGAEIDGHLGMNIKFSTKNYAKQFLCLFFANFTSRSFHLNEVFWEYEVTNLFNLEGLIIIL